MSNLSWDSYLRIKTRDPRFLWRMVLGILTLGVVSGFVAQYLPLYPSGALQLSLDATQLPGDKSRAAIALLRRASDDLEVQLPEVLELLPAVQSSLEPATPGQVAEIERVLSSGRRPQQEKRIARTLWKSLMAGSLDRQLVELAETKPRVRYASYAVGVFHLSEQNWTAAAAAFEQEGEFAAGERAREHAVRLYLVLEDLEALRRLDLKPAYDDVISPQVRLHLAALERDWGRVWWRIPATMFHTESWGPAILAGLTGLFWLVFLLQAGGALSMSRPGFWLAAAGLALGALSLWPTVFIVYWQDLGHNWEQGETLSEGLRYFVLGVGLREETCKLLLFLPLAPIIARRSELETLTVAGCVGLGFAVEENVGYFEQSFSASSVTRYLTANFLHISLTAIAGLWLCRAIRWPRDFVGQFLGMFGVIIFAHGLYDALIAVPQLAEYGFFHFVVYILVAYQFFGELRDLRGPKREAISLTANFLFGLSSIAAMTFVYVSAVLGIWLATMSFAMPTLGLAVIVYMFLREMPESLVDV